MGARLQGKKSKYFYVHLSSGFTGWLLYRRATGTTHSTMGIARRVPTMQAIDLTRNLSVLDSPGT